MGVVRNICVFCGAHTGIDHQYSEKAKELAIILAKRGIGLVNGGGNIGLMGVMADVALEYGGKVIGVIPRALVERELAHKSLTELHIVETMHTRKALMAKLSDAFIALPGGIGTLDELCEALTWAQLGFHSKPCGILNVNGFFDAFFAQIERAIADGFISKEYFPSLVIESEPGLLVDKLLRIAGLSDTSKINNGVL